MPEELGIVASFQGQLDPDHQGAQVLVFWETWCPFSQRVVPTLEDYYQRFRDMNLEVVGVTQVNKTATDQTVREFIADQELSFPVVKSDGRLNRYFQQAGTPFITVLKDGVMVWESYLDTRPAIPSALFEGLAAEGQDAD